MIRLISEIGCAGEVRLNKDALYEKWGIEILVKFRDSEQLQKLTANRQSGGVFQCTYYRNDQFRPFST